MAGNRTIVAEVDARIRFQKSWFAKTSHKFSNRQICKSEIRLFWKRIDASTSATTVLFLLDQLVMDGKRRILATFEQYCVYYESQMLNGIIKKEAYRWIKNILKAFLARKNRFQVELDRSEAGKELKVMANCVEHSLKLHRKIMDYRSVLNQYINRERETE